MPMIGKDARAVGQLLRWITHTPGTGQQIPTSDQAREAAAHLAERAYEAMAAGLRGDQIHARWPHSPALAEPDDAVCRVCGCSENAPCPGGCHWVQDPALAGDLCSRCSPVEQLLAAPGTLALVLVELAAERARQDERWGEQNHPDGTGLTGDQQTATFARKVCQKAAAGGTLTWRHILREEVAEALAEADPSALRAELVQVAAVTVAWIQAIDRRTAAGPVLGGALTETAVG